MKNFMEFLKNNKKELLLSVGAGLAIMLIGGSVFNIINIEYLIQCIVVVMIAVMVIYIREKKRS